MLLYCSAYSFPNAVGVVLVVPGVGVLGWDGMKDGMALGDERGVVNGVESDP